MDQLPVTNIEWLNNITMFFLELGETHKYWNFFLGMAIESAGVPFGSMPAVVTTSALITEGKFNIYWAIVIGALGNTLGSAISYGIGRFFGETIRKIRKKDLFSSERMLNDYTEKYGSRTIFLSQLFGFTRVFISFPAGLLKMNFKKFLVSTFLGGALFTTWYVFGSFLIRDIYDRFIYPVIGLSFASILFISGMGFLITHFSYRIGKKAHKKYRESKKNG